MEPCLFRHGKCVRDVTPAAPPGLQWSHVFSDMVSLRPLLLRRDCFLLQWSHVFSDMVREIPRGDLRAPGRASMEPCLFRHGKYCDVEQGIGLRRSLQWSHVFSDMVSKVGNAGNPCLRAASMEPCLFRHGKGFCLRLARTNSRSHGAMSFQTW